MQAQTLCCPICFNQYDLEKQTPKILSQCGHTVCAQCLGHILSSTNRRCPLDKTSFSPEQRNIVDFKTNFVLRDLIEENAMWETCKAHDKPLEFLCMTDKCKVCTDCAFFDGHRNHELKSIKELKPVIERKSREFESFLEALDINCSEINETIKNYQLSLTKMVTDEFKSLRLVLQEKEDLLMRQILSSFDKARLRVEAAIGKNSSQRSEISNKLLNFRQFSKSSEIFSIIEEDITKATAQLDSLLMNVSSKTNQFANTVKETQVTLSKALSSQLQLLNEFRFPYDFLESEFKDVLITENSQENPVNIQVENTRKEYIDISTSFQFKVFGDSLHMISNDWKPKALSIDIREWKKIKEVDLDLSQFTWDQKNIDCLQAVRSKLKGLTCIRANISNQTDISEKYFQKFCSAVFSQANYLQEIGLNFEWSKLGNKNMQYLCDQILSKVESLKGFRLNINDTDVTDEAIQALIAQLKKHMKSIETFGLNISSLDITESTIESLFMPMPSVKNYELCLENLKLTDQGFNKFVNNCLSSATALRSLKLELWYTKVGDDSIIKLFQSIIKVEKLSLNLQSTKITNKSIEYFILERLPVMRNLVDFDINVLNTEVTKVTKMKLEQARAKLLEERS